MTYNRFSIDMNDSRTLEGVDYVADNYAWESATWFWRVYKNIIITENTDNEYVTKNVNGGTQAIERRGLATDAFLRLFGVR